MSTIITKEHYRRGVVGWFFQIVFVGYNLFMALWLYAVIHQGEPFGSVFIFGMMWAVGALVFGLLARLTRGHRVTISTTV